MGLPFAMECNGICLFLKFLFFKIFWLNWVFVAVHGLPLVVASLVVEHGL